MTGVYNEGDILPSEHDLMDIHQVTRSTIRQALSILLSEEYIEKKQGFGSVVKNPRRKTLGLLSIKGFSEAVSDNKQSVSTLMINKPEIQQWSNNFFYSLTQTERNAGCISVQRIRCVDNEPVMLENTYLGNIGLPEFCVQPFIKDSLFETLNVRYQVEIKKVEQDLRAILANAEIAQILNVKVGSPLLHIYLKFHTNREFLFIYGSLLCNTERYSIGNKL